VVTGVVADEAAELEAELASFVRAVPPVAVPLVVEALVVEALVVEALVVEAPAGDARTAPAAARSYITVVSHPQQPVSQRLSTELQLLVAVHLLTCYRRLQIPKGADA
jgi:hypothetical protein